jgi:enoyl-[acyl-carrier protein] reductase III
VAMVTGSSRGFGRAIALRLARDGFDLVVHCRGAVDLAEAVAEEVRQLGRRAIVVAADLEREADIDAMFRASDAAYGPRLDAFVGNAAATVFKPTLSLGAHHIDRTFGLNVRGFVLSVQRAVERMGPGGRIVAVSGYGSIRYLPGYAALGSAKAALERWVSYLGVELAPRGIAVNAVNPGCAVTASASVYFSRAGSEPQDEVVRRTPMGRACTPEDVAGVVSFLCSPDCAFMCGQTLVVDGGLTLVAPPFATPETARQAAQSPVGSGATAP